VTGGFLLVTALASTRLPTASEILPLVGEALGLLTLVVIALRPNRPRFWLWFWLAWIVAAVGTTVLVYLAFFFRIWS
jgi:type II secretory pathway component PulF